MSSYLAKGLQCQTCRGNQGERGDCDVIQCREGEDRCMAMTFRDMDNNENYWEKKCTTNSWCKKNDVLVCREKYIELGGKHLIDKCKKVCSTANDVQVPKFPTGNICNLNDYTLHH